MTQTLFATSQPYFQDFFNLIPPPASFFGSAEAADYHCTQIASNAGLLAEPWDQSTIHYFAILNLSVGNIVQRADILGGAKFNTNGQVIFNDLSDLLAGTFSNPILDENGASIPAGTRAYTGTTTNGDPSGFNCDDWSFNGATATYGIINAPGISWLDSGTQQCTSGVSRLYCIGNN